MTIRETGRVAVITEKKVTAAKNNPLMCYSCFMMDKQKAVEIMAKEIHGYDWARYHDYPLWDELNEDTQNDYRNMAEAALDALLRA